MAYRCLARTQSLLPGLVAAVHGRRPDPASQTPPSPQIPSPRPGMPQQVLRPPHPPQQTSQQPVPSSMPPTMNGPTMLPPRDVPVPATTVVCCASRTSYYFCNILSYISATASLLLLTFVFN